MTPDDRSFRAYLRQSVWPEYLRRILIGALLILAPLAVAPTLHPAEDIPVVYVDPPARDGQRTPGPAIVCRECW